MLLRRIARPLLAGVFISSGVAVLREPKQHAEMAAPVLEPAMDLVTGFLPIEQPPETSTLIQIDAGIKIGAGVLLGLGKAPRLAATALAASLVPTTLVQHRFWEMADPSERAVHQAHFLKDLGLLGGLLLASADTEGKPSLAWRARRAGRTSAATAELFHRDVTEGVGQLSRRAAALGENASVAAGRYNGRAGQVAGRAGEVVAGRAGEVAGRAGEVAGRAGEEMAGRVHELAGWAGEAAGRTGGLLSERAERVGRRAGKRAEKARAKASKRAEEVASAATKRAEEVASAAAKRAEDVASAAGKRAEQVASAAGKRAEQAAKRAEKASKRAGKASRKAGKRAAARAQQLRADLASR
ncbi:MAG TPA: DoxX family membrane protein [Pseudonocardia sp.]